LQRSCRRRGNWTKSWRGKYRNGDGGAGDRLIRTASDDFQVLTQNLGAALGRIAPGRQKVGKSEFQSPLAQALLPIFGSAAGDPKPALQLLDLGAWRTWLWLESECQQVGGWLRGRILTRKMVEGGSCRAIPWDESRLFITSRGSVPGPIMGTIRSVGLLAGAV